MDRYKCTVCSHIYDPAKGDSAHDVEPNTPFDQLPDDWVCPICGVGQSLFEKA